MPPLGQIPLQGIALQRRAVVQIEFDVAVGGVDRDLHDIDPY